MPVKMFARKKLASWLWPSVAGPIVGMWLTLLVRALVFNGSTWGLVAWLPLGTGIAAALVVTLVLTDLCLVVLRQRIPPVGARAWISGMLAPAPLLALWEVLRPPLLSAPMHHAMMLAAALMLTAVPLRLLTSPKLGSGFRFGG